MNTKVLKKFRKGPFELSLAEWPMKRGSLHYGIMRPCKGVKANQLNSQKAIKAYFGAMSKAYEWIDEQAIAKKAAANKDSDDEVQRNGQEVLKTPVNNRRKP